MPPPTALEAKPVGIKDGYASESALEQRLLFPRPSTVAEILPPFLFARVLPVSAFLMFLLPLVSPPVQQLYLNKQFVKYTFLPCLSDEKSQA